MTSTVYFPATKKYPHSREWKLERIWELSRDLVVEEIDPNTLWNERYSKAWCWQHEGEKIDNEFFLHHMERVINSDLTYPIILSEENYIFDGVHRLVKCKLLATTTIRCVKFQKDPEPNLVK